MQKLPSSMPPTSGWCSTLPTHSTISPPIEQRAREHDVVLVQRAEERIVGQEDVAIADLARAAHDRAQRVADGADVDERADAGGRHLPVVGEQADVEVVALDHDRRRRDGADRDRLLVVDLPQPMLDHFEGDRIDFGQVGGMRAIHRAQFQLRILAVRASAAFGAVVACLTRPCSAAPSCARISMCCFSASCRNSGSFMVAA